jgi:PIN domain nuclease of toxin-antitoxin system
MGAEVASPLIAYLDTNAVIWLAAGKTTSLSAKATRLIETSDLFISAVVLLELEMLRETGKLAHGANDVLAYLAQRIGVSVCQLPMSAIVDQAISVKWTREPADRLIVANAMARNEAPLITSDRGIREHYRNAIW